ncbi:hypothetical protein [Waddlia chondrophila]|uniref:Ankyrin repeat-containing protein n=1 Tax=Waddlia chondrophila (strain ATCC VR-1470 / WSU 86-1044) TaxID=716544 RepID=D6YSN6_WADCW|nr:hypothetical protein [Waddlia chondrophila]ADI39081.1 hypothetical protein wcw_1740 [Waddlia chondrophila WSU 86-1044]
MKAFVEGGLNVHTTDDEGLEPIHYLKEDDVELAKLLIGNRRSDHDWKENKPPVMDNEDFVNWLKDREEEDVKEEEIV